MLNIAAATQYHQNFGENIEWMNKNIILKSTTQYKPKIVRFEKLNNSFAGHKPLNINQDNTEIRNNILSLFSRNSDMY